MKIALIDNGSLEPAAQHNLRRAAAALAVATGAPVTAVSWKHSDRIPADALEGIPAWTVASWVRNHWGEGEREFVFVPFFISPQGAIGSALRRDLELLAAELGPFSVRFALGLADAGVLALIVAARARETIAALDLRQPPVIVVDHGGPSAASAALRDAVAAAVRAQLAHAAGAVAAASLESPPGPGFAFNRPLFAEQLAAPGFNRGEVVVAPLFLSPGRHAGPQGDLAQIAAATRAASAGPRCHFTGLVGTHPLAVEALAGNLAALLTFPALL